MNTKESNFSIVDIPPTIIEKILSYLLYPDVNRIRSACKYLYVICGIYLKRGIMDIKHELHNYMYDINTFFLTKRLSIYEKTIYLKAYNTLEILNLSLNTIVILNRHILERDDSCLPIGFILNGFSNLVSSMKLNMFGLWPTLSMNLHGRIRRFVENMEGREPKLKAIIPLGVRAMDLIDVLMDVCYEICAIYDIPNRFCYITGHYRLADSRFLSYLPDISFISDCQDRKITEEESDIIMKYLVLLVNVHNGLLTKSEQYRRDLEFSRRTLLHDSSEFVYFDHWFESLRKPKAECSRYRKPDYREVLDGSNEVIEMYTRSESDTNVVVDDGINCFIQMKCHINEAPMQIKRSYNHLMNDIVLESKSVESINPKIFEQTSSSFVRNYGATVKLEIRLPYNNPQMIDLKFTDGESVNMT